MENNTKKQFKEMPWFNLYGWKWNKSIRVEEILHKREKKNEKWKKTQVIQWNKITI